MVETRVCKKCNKELDVSNFYFRKENNNYRSCCKKCKSVHSVEEIKARANSPFKLCKHCGVEKPISEYQKAGRGKWTQPYCKPCDFKRKKEWVNENIEIITRKRSQYYIDNKKIIKAKIEVDRKMNPYKYKERARRDRIKNAEAKRIRDREYGRKNRGKIYDSFRKKLADNPILAEIIKNKQKIYRCSLPEEEKERRRLQQKQWRAANKETIKQKRLEMADKIREQKRIWSNKKSAADVQYRLKRNLRTRIRCALKPNNAYKIDKSECLLGCKIGFYKSYIESLFTEGMSWDRFLAGEIEIDHIKPCSRFNLTIDSEQRECFNYKNTQPLWALDNLKKGARYDG